MSGTCIMKTANQLIYKIKKHLNKWGNNSVHGLEDKILKMLIFPKLTYSFNTIIIKILSSFFKNIDEIVLKFIWKGTGPLLAKTILKSKNKVSGLSFKIYHVATAIKTNNIGGGIET